MDKSHLWLLESHPKNESKWQSLMLEPFSAKTSDKAVPQIYIKNFCHFVPLTEAAHSSYPVTLMERRSLLKQIIERKLVWPLLLLIALPETIVIVVNLQKEKPKMMGRQ